jgi:VPDSG-CTERM motif
MINLSFTYGAGVPDDGYTLVLLGTALAGLALFRKRRAAA